MTSLTALQFQLITNIMHSNYGDLEQTPEDVMTYTRDTYTFEAFEGIPEASHGGMVAQAEKAGLVEVGYPEEVSFNSGEYVTLIEVTNKGKRAWLDACGARGIDYRDAGACHDAQV